MDYIEHTLITTIVSKDIIFKIDNTYNMIEYYICVDNYATQCNKSNIKCKCILFTIIITMGNSGETIFPLHIFYNKILTIRSELGLPGLYKCGSITTFFSGTPLTTFMDATEIEIRNIIKLSPAKSCKLDPLATWLLKECIAELVPTITDVVNMSLRDAQIT